MKNMHVLTYCLGLFLFGAATAQAASPDTAPVTDASGKPQSLLTSRPAPLPPTGASIVLANNTGRNGGVRIGGMYWISDRYGAGIEVGMDYLRRDRKVGTGLGSRQVLSIQSSVSPVVVANVMIFKMRTMRFLGSVGAGPYIAKPDREPVKVGMLGHAGVGLDWPIVQQLSLHVEERLAGVADPDPLVGTQVGLQTQLAAYWWFE